MFIKARQHYDFVIASLILADSALSPCEIDDMSRITFAFRSGFASQYFDMLSPLSRSDSEFAAFRGSAKEWMVGIGLGAPY